MPNGSLSIVFVNRNLALSTFLIRILPVINLWDLSHENEKFEKSIWLNVKYNAFLLSSLIVFHAPSFNAKTDNDVDMAEFNLTAI